MNRILLSLTLALVAACFVPSCQTAPPIGFEDTPEVQLQRTDLYKQLLSLLPEEQQKLPAAQAEARTLADASYKAAAAIGRINQPRRWPAWRNNVLVNSLSDSALERGLCWHYQHDMYRE
ncbi:MAG: hypothetical protein IJB64_11350, partial [Akkermansia sp.]|nr:hypothetical protein [Akkermansia sp.]